MQKEGLLKFAVALFCVLVLSLFFYPEDARAACGASLSSCKSCHEVKGANSVANSGDWHINHAFGDFCEFCHGGVVSSMDKTKAHQGLKEPFADIQGSCGSCHVTDLEEKAKVYGATLTAASSGGGASGGGNSGQVAKLELVPAEKVPEKDLIDYERELLKYQGLERNKGNIILIILNAGILLVLLYLVWKYDLQRIVFASRELTAAREEAGGTIGFTKLGLSYDELDVIDSILARPGGERLLSKLVASPDKGDEKQ